MKTCVFILSLLLILLPLPSQAQLELGFSLGRLGTDRVNDIKIGIAARDLLHDYLRKEYNHQCPAKKKKLPAICEQTVPLYSGTALRSGIGKPLSREVAKKAGFVPPGTNYVQSGFVIYLISSPRRIIIDSVTPTED
jgi:hypothetical protein